MSKLWTQEESEMFINIHNNYADSGESYFVCIIPNHECRMIKDD